MTFGDLYPYACSVKVSNINAIIAYAWSIKLKTEYKMMKIFIGELHITYVPTNVLKAHV